MQVFFADRKLQETCKQHRAMVKRFGAENTTRLRMRLQHLVRADTLADLRLLGGRCHQLTGDLAGAFALDLKHPLRLVFRPVGIEPPYDWTDITAVEITDIIDYH